MAPEPDTAALLAQAEKVQQLTREPGWAVLMGLLQNDAEEAKDELVHIDAADTEAIERCQWRVKQFEWFAGVADHVMKLGFEPETMEEEELGYE